MIEFQRPYGLEDSKKYIEDALQTAQVVGDGKYTDLCSRWLEDRLRVSDVLMTTSCTHALELAMHLLDLAPEDEVIVPSYTFPSTANAVLLAGGKVVFSQVRQSDLTLDPSRIEEKITEQTKAIIPVHYAGNVCDMKAIMALAKKYGLVVVEDSAQAFLSTYDGQFAGTIGDMGCFSFHGTKDLVSGEGGALAVNNPKYLEAAGIFRQKGTNRKAFLEGRIDRYEWVAKGSSYSPSDLLMALLYGQLQQAERILKGRQEIYKRYFEFFDREGFSTLEAYSKPGQGTEVNGHTYWICFKNKEQGILFRQKMKERGVLAYTHFVPLHTSKFGNHIPCDKSGFSVEKDLGYRLVRLPLYPALDMASVDLILEAVMDCMGGLL